MGAQENVVLLSEIHPNGVEIAKKMNLNCDLYDPIFQAHEWNGLFEKKEYEKIRSLNYNFEEKILLIFEKVEKENKKLIITQIS